MNDSTRGDTRWTAILSLDMVGFTEMSVRMENERLYGLLDDVLGLARAEIEAQGGHVVDTAGDGMLASFGAPTAVENPSVRCCRAAQAFRDRLTAEADRLTDAFGEKPRFRAGIAGGPAMVAHRAPDTVKIVGTPVILATRLQALAGADEILLSHAVQLETDGFVETRSRGQEIFKGFDEPAEVFELLGVTGDDVRFAGLVRRGLTGFVSREQEMATLAGAMDAGSALVLVSGPAGIGKSRLVYEASARLPQGRAVHIGQSVAGQGAAPFAPLLSMLRAAAGLEDSASRAESLEALTARHADLCDPARAAAFVAPLSDEEDPTGRALRDRAFLADIFAALQDRTGCAFVLEDAHWADRATLDFLTAIRGAGLGMVVTTRPEFSPAWANLPAVKVLTLEPLQQSQAVQIACEVLGGPVAPTLASLIAQKSEGLPLMAEELARALQSGGHLRQSAAGFELANPEAPLLTGNLEQLVLSRIDPLPGHLRDVINCAAAEGREFQERVLAGVGFSPDGLTEIDRMAQGLIERIAPGRWRFTHALIRDAVYASLLQSQRRDIHARIAAAMEADGPAHMESPAVLAEHFEKSEQVVRAAFYLVKEAGEALDAYALEHADATATHAWELIEGDLSRLPPDVADDLAVTWLRVLDQTGLFAKQSEVGHTMLKQLEAMGGSRQAVRISRTLIALGTTHLRGYRLSEEMAKQSLRDSEEAGDDWGMAFSCLALMRVYEETNWQPRSVIEDLAARIAPVAEARQDRHLEMTSLYNLGAIYRSTGHRLRAIKVSEEIARIAREHNNLRAMGYATWSRGLIHTTEGDPLKAREVIGDYNTYTVPGSADHIVMRAIEAYCSIFLDSEELALERIQSVHAWADHMGDQNIIQSMQWCRALLECRVGRIATGWRMINYLVGLTQRGGCIPFVRQALVLRAEVSLAILGLVDPAKEMEGRVPPPSRARPGLADILRFARIRLTGARQARADLERIVELDPEKHGGIYALARIGLGLLAARRKEMDNARDHLQAGLAAAEEEELELLTNRARNALDRLG